MPASNDMIICPLTDSEMEIGDCVICSDVAAGMLKENCIEEKYRKKDDWREICRKCEYHNM
mgnify:FL=1